MHITHPCYINISKTICVYSANTNKKYKNRWENDVSIYTINSDKKGEEQCDH